MSTQITAARGRKQSKMPPLVLKTAIDKQAIAAAEEAYTGLLAGASLLRAAASSLQTPGFALNIEAAWFAARAGQSRIDTAKDDLDFVGGQFDDQFSALRHELFASLGVLTCALNMLDTDGLEEQVGKMEEASAEAISSALHVAADIASATGHRVDAFTLEMRETIRSTRDAKQAARGDA